MKDAQIALGCLAFIASHAWTAYAAWHHFSAWMMFPLLGILVFLLALWCAAFPLKAPPSSEPGA